MSRSETPITWGTEALSRAVARTGRGRLWHGGSNGMSHSVAFIAPEIDFAVLVACNRGLDIAIWKTRQTARALIRALGPFLLHLPDAVEAGPGPGLI